MVWAWGRSGRASVLAIAMLASGSVSCLLFGEEEQTDGQVCTDDGQCSTGRCTAAALCAHSSCGCAGEACDEGGEVTSDCRDGWVGVVHTSILEAFGDSVIDFFGGEPSDNTGYCQPLCAHGCPEHYLCNEGDTFCRPDQEWADPQVTLAWEGDVAGTSMASVDGEPDRVVVQGGSEMSISWSMDSPVGAEVQTATWTTVTGAGDYEEADEPTLEITVPDGGSYRRVELELTDTLSNYSKTTVIFEACSAAGATCSGYMGEDCCNGCDLETDTCL